MSSDDECDTKDIVSERETQFVPRSDDDEVLWEVLEITAERGKKYRVRWDGIDPATRKPWAQSWVPKHDCTDKLVAEWKAKKKKPAAEKKHGRPSTASRASGSSKRAGSSASRKTRPSTSKSTSSRLDSVEQQHSPSPKKSIAKRKRQSETPATTSSGAVHADEQNELPRPRKKQKMILEVLLPPLSSDEDGDALPEPKASVQVTPRNKMPSKSNGASLDGSDTEYSSPPKAKSKPVRRSDARSAGGSRASDAREEPRLNHSKLKAKPVPRPEECVADAEGSSQDELPPSKLKKKLKRKSLVEQNNEVSEKEVESALTPIKVGPPRGVKRREKSKESKSSKPVSSRAKPRESHSGEDRPPDDIAPSLSIQQDAADDPTLPPPAHISIPLLSPSARSHSPELSPGAQARLELFDRMIADLSEPHPAPPPVDAPESAPDHVDFNYDDTHDIHDDFITFDPSHPLIPPPSKPNPKLPKQHTPNGLIVPETESSGNSQSQERPLLQPPSPQPPPVRDQPRKLVDLPTIAVIAASAPSSSVSPVDLIAPPRRFPPYANRPSKKQTLKPVPQISPATFRATINVHSHVTDSEPPPSSIESFTSPKRVDKGKQRAAEEDELQSSLPEGKEDGERRKRQVKKKLKLKFTDSELGKRGKVFFDQIQRTPEARWTREAQKRLKTVNEIVNGVTASPPKGSSLPSAGGAETTFEMRLEDVVDLSGGANSVTLDTPEHSEAKPMSEEERKRLRIELRQEEEEDTQEAMGVYSSPAKKCEVVDNRDAHMLPPGSLKDSSCTKSIEDGDHIEQPSTELQLASVIVQASQEQRHEDTDVEPLPTNPSTSSPARPIPEHLTDSPKRRLGEALSLLHVKSEEIQRLERELADERKNMQSLKAELAETQQSSEPTAAVRAAWDAERAQWAQERSKWEADASEWQTHRREMSEEKANLSARMAELSDALARAEQVKVRLAELGAERDAWTRERDALLNDMTLRSEELIVFSQSRGEYDKDRLQWETERGSWAEEKARWEAERATLQEKQEKQEELSRSVGELTAKVELATAAKVSAEKDREFFREQYAQASGFVGSVRAENLELEKRVKIAEGQAQEGVAAIRALFEGRVKTLQADIDSWKGLSELLQEKDRRTNDELRLRAAETPELQDLCARLGVDNRTLRADVRRLELTQQRSTNKRKKLYHEIFTLKKEREVLRSKLSQLVNLAGTVSQEAPDVGPAPLDVEDTESIDPNDMEMLPDPMPQSSDVSFDDPALFPCMWRPRWRDQCQQLFDTKEDLERHLQDHLRDLMT